MTTRGHGPKPSELTAPQAARSIAELAASSTAWKVQLGDFGRWITADRVIQLDEQHWRIGLTPVNEKIVAAMLWQDDEVVAHLRGTEGDVRSNTPLDDRLGRRLPRGQPRPAGRGQADLRPAPALPLPAIGLTRGPPMTRVFSAHAVSVDGFITGRAPGPGRGLGDAGLLFDWYFDGDTGR